MHVATVTSTSRYLGAVLALAVVLAMSGCAAAGSGASVDPPDGREGVAVPPAATTPPLRPRASVPATPSGHFDRLPADSQFQRFIVKYRADTPPGRDPASARERLAGVQSASGIPLEWLRRLGVDADVFKAAQPLDRQAAAALMERFSADPDVEYIEVDSVLTIRTGVDIPPVKPLSE
ncbi:MAG: hypothetical protein ABIO84_01530 [Lysobacter sp.]